MNLLSELVKCDAAINGECSFGNEQGRCTFNKIEEYHVARVTDPNKPYMQQWGTIKEISGQRLEPCEIASCWNFEPTEKYKQHIRELVVGIQIKRGHVLSE